MIIGFTGTQAGMTANQQLALIDLLTVKKLAGSAAVFHHGDCVGADEEAHEIAINLGYEIIIHPPTASYKRAFCSPGTVLFAHAYLRRNKDIVDACELLIAAPRGEEELRSGTWSTVRYARKTARALRILTP